MIIGASGKGRSGKGEFARVAREKHGAIEISFAGVLKQEVADFLKAACITFEERNLYGENVDKEESVKISSAQASCIMKTFPEFRSFLALFSESTGCICGKCKPVTFNFNFRSLMQWWGTEYRRKQDNNYWVKRALLLCENPKELYVISDVRFKNEATAIREAGGKLVRVVRKDRPEISNANHPSEIDLDDWSNWDAVIANDWDLSHYHSLADHIIYNLVRNSDGR